MKRVIALVLASLLFAPPAFAQSAGWAGAIGGFLQGYQQGAANRRANDEMRKAQQLREQAAMVSTADPNAAATYLDEARSLDADAYAERQQATPPPRINCWSDGHGFTSCSPAP